MPSTVPRKARVLDQESTLAREDRNQIEKGLPGGYAIYRRGKRGVSMRQFKSKEAALRAWAKLDVREGSAQLMGPRGGLIAYVLPQESALLHLRLLKAAVR